MSVSLQSRTGQSGGSTSGRPREAGLDALRALLTLLVVFHHAAITYGASGDWYYVEIPQASTLASRLMSLFTAANQAFFMGLFLLIAGYFTPGAVQRRGAAGYLRERLLRLGWPLLVYVLLLSPATMALAATARGRNAFRALLFNWSHWRMEPGPLWFCEALLIFAAAYVALRALVPAAARSRAPAFPSNGTLALAALGTGVAAFLLRLVWPTGATVLFLQLGFFASYVVLFVAGCLAAKWPTLDEAPAAQRRLWLWVAALTFPLMPIAFVLGQHVPWLDGPQSGGWNVQALVYALWEPFLAWGVIIGLVHFMTTRLESPGPLWRSLSRRAYTIYIVHPPVLVGIAFLWASVSAPPAVKWVVTGSATCVVCYALAGVLLRSPTARKVL